MLRALVVMTVLPPLSGCGGNVHGPLPNDPDQLTIYSIDGPSHYKQGGKLTPAEAKGELLHGYPVLGKVELTDPEQKRVVVAAINSAVRDNPTPSKCFIPRHAVRVVKGGETVEMLICFQCNNYERYQQGEWVRGGSPPISASAQPLLDQTLTDAGVPLAAKD